MAATVRQSSLAIFSVDTFTSRASRLRTCRSAPVHGFPSLFGAMKPLLISAPFPIRRLWSVLYAFVITGSSFRELTLDPTMIPNAVRSPSTARRTRSSCVPRSASGRSHHLELAHLRAIAVVGGDHGGDPQQDVPSGRGGDRFAHLRRGGEGGACVGRHGGWIVPDDHREPISRVRGLEPEASHGLQAP